MMMPLRSERRERERRERERRAEPAVASAHGPPSVDPAEAKRELVATLVEAAAGTQEELSEALGISYATLHAWKTDRREVPDHALEDLAREALKRGRLLMETGSRLLRLADAEASASREREELRLTAAELRARARATRQHTPGTMDRPRRGGR